jgi:hypothetical protein
MDPIIKYAQRGSASSKGLLYDDSFWFSNPHVEELLQPSREPVEALYANTQLVTYFNTLQREYVRPTDNASVQNLIYERAHPLGSIPRIFKEGENVDLRYLRILFGFSPTETVHSNSDLLKVVLDRLNVDEIPNILVVSVNQLLSNIDCHALYLLALHYERITLLQPAISVYRYCICVNRTATRYVKREDIAALSTQGDLSSLTKLFNDIPSAFITWLLMLNNIYISYNAELLIHLIESKEAYDRNFGYYPGASYDRQKIIRLLKGENPIHDVVQPNDIERTDDVEKINQRFGMHLWNENEIPIMEHLHTTINIETDHRVPYVSKLKGPRSGDHWGQRKLLLTEIDFFIEHMKHNEPTLIFYVGAAPFDHGVLLSKWFQNAVFWLIDPRSAWNPMLNTLYLEGRMMSSTALFNEAYVDVLRRIKNGGPIPEGFAKGSQSLKRFLNMDRVLFISDIRSDVIEMYHEQRERTIEGDMNIQLNGLNEFKALLNPTAQKNFVASLKFRLSFDRTRPQDYMYLPGILRVQPWEPLRSTELRLWTKGGDITTRYDKLAVEEIMAYHNNIVRAARFGNTGIDGYDECHDCHFEADILRRFVTKFRKPLEMYRNIPSDVLVLKLSKEINVQLKKDGEVEVPTLSSHSVFTQSKRDVIHRDSKRFNVKFELIRSRLMKGIRHEFIVACRAIPEFPKTDDSTLQTIFKEVYYYVTAIDRTRAEALSSDIRFSDPQIIGWIGPHLDTSSAVSVNVALQEILHYSGIGNFSLSDCQKVVERTNSKIFKTYEVIARELATNTALPQVVKVFKDPKVSFNAGGTKTFSVNKELLLKFLSLGGGERLSGKTPTQLLNSASFQERVFCVLLRYKSIWLRTMSQLPVSLIDANPELLDSINTVYCGNTIFSAMVDKNGTINESVASLYSDMDLYFTTRVNPFITPQYDAKQIVVFPPNITPLITAYVKVLLKMMLEASMRSLAIIFIIPEGPYVQLIQDSPNAQQGRFREYDFNGIVYDYRVAEDTKLGIPRKIYVIKSIESTFELQLP